MNKKMLVAILSAAMLTIFSLAVFAEGPRGGDAVGAVYTMTNAANGNEVVIFDRDAKGMLMLTGSVSTEGTGSGGGLDPLASQGSLVLSENKRWLLAVNAGSNEISVFRVLPKGLMFVDKVASGGTFPVSVTIFHDLVYVLNAGMSPNISGFYLSHKGELTPLPNSTRSLVGGGFSQVGFDPQGEMLAVTDRAGSTILVYSVGDDGLPGMNPVTSPSNGAGPFAFIFDQRGHLIVVEVGVNAVSSYNILDDGTLQVISASIANGQRASCWITGNQRGNIFTANPGTSSISAFKLSAGNGKIALLDGTAGHGNAPLDMAVSVNGQFLYALDPGNGGIDMFQIESDGSLIALGTAAGGLSIFAQGMAAR